MGLLLEFKITWEAFWELIFPSNLYCINCKSALNQDSQYGICNACIENISFVDKGRWIQSSFYSNDGKGIRMFSATSYSGEIKSIIYAFKYKQQTHLSRPLAQLMKSFLDREGLQIDVIIPVPLYYKKERRRGFNQSSLLAKYLSDYTGVGLVSSSLYRVRNTVVMHNLSKSERVKNVKAAFKLKNPCKIIGKRVLLVDDILTTGATIEECGRVLYEGGASEVMALTLSRGTLDKG